MNEPMNEPMNETEASGKHPSRRLVALAFAVLAVVALTAAGCGSDDDGDTATGDTATSDSSTGGTPAEAGEVTVDISDPWSRATAPTAERGAVYLVLEATGGDDALIGASVDPTIAGTVEIHETVAAEEGESDMSGDTGATEDTGMTDDTGATEDTGMSDDTGMGGMSMRPIEKLDLPAGEQVVLEPGGYHIMLLDLPDPLVAGETFELTLQFEQGGTQTVTVEVREA